MCFSLKQEGQVVGIIFCVILSNNEKLNSESALEMADCKDLKERKLAISRERKDSESIFCVILIAQIPY